MKESRIISYGLIKLGNAHAFEQSLVKINGVISVKVNQEDMRLSYEIDEWASDYDVFTEVMRIADECGMEINFGGACEDSENSEENLVDYSSSQNGEVEVEEESVPEKKKGALSERTQRIIELSAALICYVVALLFKKDIPQYIFLAMAFAVAGYDALYQTFIKFTKKIIFSEELLISLAFFSSIFLGYAKYAVIAVLLYSFVAFAKKTIKEEIDKNPIFANTDQKVVLVSENGVKNVSVQEVTVDSCVLLNGGCISPFDGVATSEGIVKNYKGEAREVKNGDLIFAGERIESDIELTVTAIGDDCKFGKYNNFIRKASQTNSPVANFINKWEQIISAAVFGVCLIMAFIFPLFSNSYSYSSLLKVWAYRAIIIASISGLSFYTFASEINLLSALIRSRKCKLAFANYEAISKTASGKKIFIDFEGALLDEELNIKQDSYGAVKELKDYKLKDIALACNIEEDKVDEICKALKIKQCYLRATKEEKLAEIKKALSQGAICVTDTKNAHALSGEKGAVVCLNCEKDGYNGDACISSDGIAYFPYAIKLARRTAKIQKINLILALLVKAALITLACLGIAQLWWAVLVDSLVSVICAINAFINSKEVY